MQIIQKNVEEIKEYENNPRNNEAAVEYVANSIKEFGFKNPVIIDKDNVIVAGHTRILAAKQLGIKEVPCIVADDLTPEQVNAFRLADNKVAEMADWDFDKLDDELEKLGNADWDMSSFGFDVTQTTDFAPFFEPNPNPPPLPPASDEVDDEEDDDTNDEQGNTSYVVCPHCGQRIDLD